MKQRTMYLFILILLSNLIAQDKDKSLTGIFPAASSVLDSLFSTSANQP